MTSIFCYNEISEEKEKESFISDFLKLTSKIYQNDNQWMGEDEERVTNFIKAKENDAFLLFLNEHVVARILIITQSSYDQAWFHYFECIEEYKDKCMILLDRVEEILKSQGIVEVLGPKLNNLELGLLIKGFNFPQSILSSHNPPYYAKIFKKAGYKVYQKTFAFYFTRKSVRKFNFVKNEDVSIRQFDTDNLDREIEIFHYLNVNIFQGQNDYITRSLEEERELVMSLLPLLDPRLVLIAQDSEKKPIGMIVALPDANQLRIEGKISRARIISIAVLPEWHRKKVGSQLAEQLYNNLMSFDNYQYAEASFILESNIASQLLAMRFNAKKGRVFSLLKKRL